MAECGCPGAGRQRSGRRRTPSSRGPPHTRPPCGGHRSNTTQRLHDVIVVRGGGGGGPPPLCPRLLGPCRTARPLGGAIVAKRLRDWRFHCWPGGGGGAHAALSQALMDASATARLLLAFCVPPALVLLVAASSSSRTRVLFGTVWPRSAAGRSGGPPRHACGAGEGAIRRPDGGAKFSPENSLRIAE